MINIADMPEEEPVSQLYKVECGEKSIPVYTCRVSAVPLNQVWPGYQRPINQTEEAAFIAFEFDGQVTLKITPARKFNSTEVKPLSRRVDSVTEGQTVTLTLTKHGQYTFEPDGFHGALHIFADAPKDYGVHDGDKDVLWFGAGTHDVGLVELYDNQTVYIAAGAVVYGGFMARNSKNIRVLGRGVIDNSRLERGKGSCLRFTQCENIEVDGPVLKDASEWTLACFACRDIAVNDVKLVGMWRYNSDGVDFCNCHNARLTGSFLRNFDDCVVIKGLHGCDSQTVKNIRVSDCVVWCDWGRGLELGAETVADEFADITFENIDIIRSTHIAMDIQSGDRADIHGVTFDNIRVEYDSLTPAPVYQNRDDEIYANPDKSFMPTLMYSCIYSCMWSKDTVRGRTHDITFRNISVTAPAMPASAFSGFDGEHMTKGVRIENLSLNGTKITTLSDAKVTVGNFADDITLK